MTDELGGRTRIVRFGPNLDAVVDEMEAMRGIPQGDVIREAVKLYRFALGEWYDGNKLLVQRRGVVTEIVPPEPGRVAGEIAPPPPATDEPPR